MHHFQPKTKIQPMEWHHPLSPRRKKFKTASAGKVIVTVFWNCGGAILVDVMPKGATINLEAYISTLNKLKKRFRRVRPGKNPAEILLQHDSAHPHKSAYRKKHHQNRAALATLQPRSVTVRCFTWDSFWKWQQRDWCSEEVTTHVGQVVVSAVNICTRSTLV